MATTTNFGWETPDDTDLVKDGALAMRTLGNSIDTSFVDLKGGTTGQVLSKASNTDLDFTWVAQDDSNAIQNAIVDAKGDLISATAADTPARLAVGTNGQVLTADSSTSTGLKWATPATVSSGLTFITAANPSGSAATNVDNCFTSTYENYFIIYYLTASTTSNNRLAIRLRASGSDLTSNYKNAGSYTNGASGAIGFNDLETGYMMISQNDSGGAYMAYGVMQVIRPQASDYTRVIINSSGYNGTSQFSYDFRSFVNNTNSYDGFTIYVPSGNVTGNFRVYGYSNS
jgi:hypothetical protein